MERGRTAIVYVTEVSGRKKSGCEVETAQERARQRARSVGKEKMTTTKSSTKKQGGMKRTEVDNMLTGFCVGTHVLMYS